MSISHNIPVASQPVSPRHDKVNKNSPNPPDAKNENNQNQDSHIFDKPLPIQTASQPSNRNHVKWDIETTSPSKKTLTINTPFSSLSVDPKIISNFPINQTTEAIEDMVRDLSSQNRSNSSPVGSDDDTPNDNGAIIDDDYLMKVNSQENMEDGNQDKNDNNSMSLKAPMLQALNVPFNENQNSILAPENQKQVLPFDIPEDMKPVPFDAPTLKLLPSINNNDGNNNVNTQEDSKEEVLVIDASITMSEVPTEQQTPSTEIFLSPIDSPQKSGRKRPITPQNERNSYSSLFFAQPKNVYAYNGFSGGMTAPPPSEEDIEQSLKIFKRSKRAPSKERIIYVEQHLERKKMEAISSGDYLEAERIENLSKDIRNAYSNEQQVDYSDVRLQPFLERLDEAKSELSAEQKTWNQRIERAKRQCYSKLEEFDNMQEQALQEFDEKWNDPNYLRAYSKPSTQLNTMRKLERKLVILKSYGEAAQMKKKADKMEKEETKQNQQRGVNEMIKQRNQLIAQQKIEREDYARKLRQSLLLMKKQKEDNVEVLKKKVSNIERRIEALKKEKQPWTPSDQQAVSTPRTASKMVKFRNEPYFKPLNIKPMRSVSVTQKKKKRILVGSKRVFDI